MNTYTRIKDIIIEQTGCNADQVEPSAQLVDDLDAPLHLLNIVELEFDITIPDHEADGLRTVQDLVTVVEGRAA